MTEASPLRPVTGAPSWRRLVGLLALRPALALAAQALMAGVLCRRGEAHPWQKAAGWWVVHGSLVDAGCLAALAVLTRREGGRLTDLLGDRHVASGSGLEGTLGTGAAFLPAIALSAALQRAFYGAEPPPQVSTIHLPRPAAAYSIQVWPGLWAATEEMTYLGYVFPRLEALSGSTRRTAALVTACWAIQHITMPFLPGRRYLLARALTALPITGVTTLLYLWRGRRLGSLIVLHWAADAATALMALAVTRQTGAEALSRSVGRGSHW